MTTLTTAAAHANDDLSAFKVSAQIAPLVSSEVPATASPWSVFPAWVQEALKVVFNNLKNHYLESVSAKKQIEKLEDYRTSTSSWPQFVLAAVPGPASFSVDSTVVSEEERSSMSAAIQQAVDAAHLVVFQQALQAKKLAWQRHHDLADSSRALRSLRCRFFENLQAMGILADNQNPYLGLLSRSLSHLGYMIQDLDTKTRWASVSAARARDKKDAARSAADIVMSDTSVASKSVEKLVDERLTQKLKSLAYREKAPVPGSLAPPRDGFKKESRLQASPPPSPLPRPTTTTTKNVWPPPPPRSSPSKGQKIPPPPPPPKRKNK
ncbi:hypothetical protein BDB00DRAFT_829256 [Zychaea mexicana]|uniref:uncharacterized protein n=1 Tax=Zychaea mexicana TaxID=64656 RepID=UPI0022FF00EF|nr:uncharacterized protein BDB00DRAFT_829256 [Zychaea mexicana]KAI9492326.1 hypothetical protein BDB00DRAFT_829256 [Zychaea mexicana]